MYSSISCGNHLGLIEGVKPSNFINVNIFFALIYVPGLAATNVLKSQLKTHPQILHSRLW